MFPPIFHGPLAHVLELQYLCVLGFLIIGPPILSIYSKPVVPQEK